MKRVTIYQKPTCTTCRKVSVILQRRGVETDAINYYLDPIPKEKLKELLFKMNMSAKELLRTKENIYKELEIADSNFTEDYIIDLMLKHPDLIQRPIVERANKAIIARPPEKVLEIL